MSCFSVSDLHNPRKHLLEWRAIVGRHGSFTIGQRLVRCSGLIDGLRGGLLVETLPLQPMLVKDLNCLQGNGFIR